MFGIGSKLLSKRLSAFKRSEKGAVTVESVLWVPLYLFTFAFIADTCLIFHAQAKALRIAYDGNRQASVGQFTSANATQTAILGRIQVFSPNATVTTTINGDDIRTIVVMPTTDLAAMGLIPALLNIDMTVHSAHMMDPEV